ncbi:hypothetical protein CFP56_033379 [Quercus suber]|uniref:Uncharacterized protein n=1 Tax=Quercus suber TaxID=58331 RepID=A0AAW0LRR2_QUESU
MDQLVAEDSMETPSNQNTAEQSSRPRRKGGFRTMPFIIAISNALDIVGAFLADSFLGRFWVIALGSFSSLLP